MLYPPPLSAARYLPRRGFTQYAPFNFLIPARTHANIHWWAVIWVSRPILPTFNETVQWKVRSSGNPCRRCIPTRCSLGHQTFQSTPNSNTNRSSLPVSPLPKTSRPKPPASLSLQSSPSYRRTSISPVYPTALPSPSPCPRPSQTVRGTLCPLHSSYDDSDSNSEDEREAHALIVEAHRFLDAYRAPSRPRKSWSPLFNEEMVAAFDAIAAKRAARRTRPRKDYPDDDRSPSSPTPARPQPATAPPSPVTHFPPDAIGAVHESPSSRSYRNLLGSPQRLGGEKREF